MFDQLFKSSQAECLRPNYYVIKLFNFVHISSAMSDDNTDPVIKWWWL
jgi:hypothetical protein